MKNPFYVVETFHANSGWDMPEWHEEYTTKTLKRALAYKANLLAMRESDYGGKMIRTWRAKKCELLNTARRLLAKLLDF